MAPTPTGTTTIPALDRRRFLRLSGMSGLAVAGTAALAACGSSSAASGSASSSATPVAGGTLRFGVETEPGGLNPQVNNQAAVRGQLRNLFDSYLYKDAEGAYHPWLADSYEVGQDGTTVTLHLKDGITFADGDPLNADAVLANFDNFTDPTYAATAAVNRSSLASWTKGADELTVVFTLSQPDNLFLDYLASIGSTPLSPTSLASPNLQSGGADVVGTGPFTIEDYRQGDKLVLARREDYAWAPEALTGRQGAAWLDSIEISFLPEASARIGALQSSQVDLIDGVAAQYVSQFDGVGGFAYEKVSNTGTPYALYLNVSKAPLDDVRVRQALQKAVHIDALITSLYYGTADRALSAISPLSPFYDADLDPSYLAYDADAANSLLDEAGWTERDSEGYRTKDGERLTVRIFSSALYVRDSRDDLNLAISDAMKQNVGVDYQFEAVDEGTEAEHADANDYEIFDNTYNATDVALALDLLYNSDPTKGAIARGKYNDAQLDDWLNTARASTDTAERTDIYTKVQEYVVGEQAYVLPVYVPGNSIARLESTQGVLFDDGAGNIAGFYNVWLNS